MSDTTIASKKPKSNEIDMLNGPLFKNILFFALPLAASSLLQELFNSIDIAVVGHFIGSEALAAVGSNAPVIGLLINLFLGISMGACAIISNHIGQQDHRKGQDHIGKNRRRKCRFGSHRHRPYPLGDPRRAV